jgi:hypothetical protein
MGEEIKNPSEKAKEKKKKPQIWKKGQSGNPAGRPPGTLNFATKFRKFIEKVAKQNDIKPEEVEEQLMAIGFKEAKAGNYNFWRDLNDRVYGKAKESIDLTSKGEKIEGITFEVIKNETKNEDQRGAGKEPEGAGKPEDKDNTECGKQ